MAKRPITKAVAVHVGDAARCIDVMARGAGQARVHDADVRSSLLRRGKFGQQAVGRLGVGETEPMERDVTPGPDWITDWQRPPKMVTVSGNTSCFVIRDMASWLPRIM